MSKKYLILVYLFIFPNFFIGQQRIDAPSSYTQHYLIKKWAQKAWPSADSLNANWDMIDSLFNALIVFIDTTQFIIVDDTLRTSNYMSGHGVFNGDMEEDTINIVGIDSLDIVVVSVREGVPTSNDLLGVKITNNQFIILRNSGGTSNLKYNWIWIRRYD